MSNWKHRYCWDPLPTVRDWWQKGEPSCFHSLRLQTLHAGAATCWLGRSNESHTESQVWLKRNVLHRSDKGGSSKCRLCRHSCHMFWIHNLTFGTNCHLCPHWVMSFHTLCWMNWDNDWCRDDSFPSMLSRCYRRWWEMISWCWRLSWLLSNLIFRLGRCRCVSKGCEWNVKMPFRFERRVNQVTAHGIALLDSLRIVHDDSCLRNHSSDNQ